MDSQETPVFYEDQIATKMEKVGTNQTEIQNLETEKKKEEKIKDDNLQAYLLDEQNPSWCEEDKQCFEEYKAYLDADNEAAVQLFAQSR